MDAIVPLVSIAALFGALFYVRSRDNRQRGDVFAALVERHGGHRDGHGARFDVDGQSVDASVGLTGKDLSRVDHALLDADYPFPDMPRRTRDTWVARVAAVAPSPWRVWDGGGFVRLGRPGASPPAERFDEGLAIYRQARLPELIGDPALRACDALRYVPASGVGSRGEPRRRPRRPSPGSAGAGPRPRVARGRDRSGPPGGRGAARPGHDPARHRRRLPLTAERSVGDEDAAREGGHHAAGAVAHGVGVAGGR